MRPLQLTLVQMGKIVIFCAVALACIAPPVRLWQAGGVAGGSWEGLLAVATLEGVAVPLVWVVLTVFLVRDGAWRDGLILALLLVSVLVALGFASSLLVRITIPQYNNPLTPPASRIGPRFLSTHLAIIGTLVTAAWFLVVRLRRGWRTARSRLPTARMADV